MADGLDLPEIVRRTVQANAKFYKAWVDLSLDYVRGLSEILAGAPASGGTGTTTGVPAQETTAGAGALVVEGEDGSTVRAAFLVSNDLGRKLTCELFASDFAAPDGVEVKIPATFEPARVELEPGEQRVVHALVTIDASLAAGVAHTGSFAIRGMDGFAVPVIVRRRHDVEEMTREVSSDTRDAATSNAATPLAPAGKGSARKAGGPRKKRRRGG